MADAVVKMAEDIKATIKDAKAPAPAPDETSEDAMAPDPAPDEMIPEATAAREDERVSALGGAGQRTLLQSDDPFATRLQNELELPLAEYEPPLAEYEPDDEVEEFSMAPAPAPEEARRRALLQSDDPFAARLQSERELPLTTEYEPDDEVEMEDAMAPSPGRRSLLQAYEASMAPESDYAQPPDMEPVDEDGYAMPMPLIPTDPMTDDDAMAPTPDLVKRRALKQLDYVDYEAAAVAAQVPAAAPEYAPAPAAF